MNPTIEYRPFSNKNVRDLLLGKAPQLEPGSVQERRAGGRLEGTGRENRGSVKSRRDHPAFRAFAGEIHQYYLHGPSAQRSFFAQRQ